MGFWRHGPGTVPDDMMIQRVHAIGEVPCAAAGGAAGPTGATGDDGSQGVQGKVGPAGDDAPCVDCSVLTDAVIDFTCKILAANPPTSEATFDECVDAVVDALTLTTNRRQAATGCAWPIVIMISLPSKFPS